MHNWKFWRLVILLVLLGAFAWTLYTRGIVGRFGGGGVAALATDYKTEHEWAVREIALDIEEMAAFADRRSPRPMPENRPTTPWDPDTFVAVAASAFGDAAKASDTLVVEVYPRLIAMDVAALVESSAAVSELLASNMRDAHAHESAALVIGAFALREAADWFTDVRWSLNRMTAHLAVAKALRQEEQQSPDGALARVVLLALSNNQARALAELGKLGEGTPPEPLNSWIRSLRLRITQDWRLLPEPVAASRLEKLEYFRARRATVRRQRAIPLLDSIGELPAIDFSRIAQDSVVGVEDGHQIVMPALDLELEEAAAAYQLLHNRSMPTSPSEALNHRATRLIDGAPHVLPWGAWAEHYQRHIAMNMGMVDSYVRHMLGRHDAANAWKLEVADRIGELTLFPIGTLRWTKGSQGSEADLAYLRDMIDLTVKAPELVPVRAWSFAEDGSLYEPVPKLMPKRGEWFAMATAAAPFEAGLRKVANDVEAVIAAAPHDMPLLIATAAGGTPDVASVKYARGLLEHNHDFDLRALDASLSHAADESSRIPLRRKACAINSRDCIALASSLLHFENDEPGAVAVYERAFADPDIDALARAADSYWLVTYYQRTGQTAKALALAEQVASTGSASGTYTRARLYERLGRLDEAEQDFLDNAQRYKDLNGLVAFYYRRVEVEGNIVYANKWAKWRAEVFPNGLQPEPASLTGVPQTGVFISGDSEYSRRAGIRTGDIVVGLEGWRVDTTAQYQTINVFKDDSTVRLTISRGGRLIKVDAMSPTRLFGTRLETHPMKGWIKD